MRESAIQAQIVDLIRRAIPDAIVYAQTQTPQSRTVSGYVAGVPDLCIIMPGGKAHYIEVKAAGGRLGPDQSAFINRLFEKSIPAAVVYSVEEAKDALANWGLLKAERLVDGALL